MRIQPILNTYSFFPKSNVKNNISNPFKNSGLSFRGEEDSFVAEEKPLSVKEQNEKIIRSYHEDILVEIGYYPKVLEDGKFQILKYRTTDKEALLKNFSIKEEDLFKSIEVIMGDADFRRSEMTNLGSLKKIGGNLSLAKSNIVDLSGLEEVKGDIYLNNKIKSIGNVKVGGIVHFNDGAKIDVRELKNKHIKFVKKRS